MQFGHDDFCGRDAEFFVDADRDASAEVSDRERVIGVQGDFNSAGVACEVFVNRVVNDFPNTVMESGSVVRVAKIHTRSFSYCFKALKNLYTGCTVIV